MDVAIQVVFFGVIPRPLLQIIRTINEKALIITVEIEGVKLFIRRVDLTVSLEDR